jgi:hypothetical protein
MDHCQLAMEAALRRCNIKATPTPCNTQSTPSASCRLTRRKSWGFFARVSTQVALCVFQCFSLHSRLQYMTSWPRPLHLIQKCVS